MTTITYPVPLPVARSTSSFSDGFFIQNKQQAQEDGESDSNRTWSSRSLIVAILHTYAQKRSTFVLQASIK